MTFIKVTLLENGKPGSSFINREGEIDVSALFDGADVGEIYQLEKVDITEEEFDNIPEFTGF